MSRGSYVQLRRYLAFQPHCISLGTLETAKFSMGVCRYVSRPNTVGVHLPKSTQGRNISMKGPVASFFSGLPVLVICDKETRAFHLIARKCDQRKEQ